MIYTYRKVNAKNLREKIAKVRMTSKPLFFIKIETTGLEADSADLIGISIVKARWTDGVLKKEDVFESLIYSPAFITPKIYELTGINREMLKNAPAADDVMKEVAEFLGKDAYVLCFNTKFLGSFLGKYNLSIELTLDINLLSKAVFRDLSGYGYLKKQLGSESPVVIFAKLLNLFPQGIMIPDKNIVYEDIYFDGYDIMTENKEFFDTFDMDYIFDQFELNRRLA